MIQTSFSFPDFAFGSGLILDLVSRKTSLQPLAGDFFSLQNLEAKTNTRNQFPIDRKTLVQALKNQNASLKVSARTRANTEALLNENTFTVTTGHQLNLLTGPMFSIYKIAQVITLADALKKQHPQKQFVPVFWMATEDHDFEEINHIHLFGKKLAWDKPGQESVIAGRIQPGSLNSFFDEVSALYQNEELKTKLAELANFYLQSNSLAEATRKLINHVFGETGLVIIDGDDPSLKALLKPVLLKEIREQVTFKAVSETNAVLEKAGYHQQVHVRECNLFFIHTDGKRERIVFENGQFTFNGKNHNTSEVEKLIEANPESFSPNALLRPVYQEILLPNLAYVGGGGEIAYWLQLRSVFEKFNVSWPLLRVRDSVFVLNGKQAEDIEKSGFTLPQLQKPADQLLKELTLEKMGDAVSMAAAQQELETVKKGVLEKVQQIEPGISGMVEAEFAKMYTALEKLEARLIKSEKSKDESTKNRLVKLQEKLFPQNHFQERHDNFLNHYLNDPQFISKVLETVKATDEPQIRTLIL